MISEVSNLHVVKLEYVLRKFNVGKLRVDFLNLEVVTQKFSLKSGQTGGGA